MSLVRPALRSVRSISAVWSVLVAALVLVLLTGSAAAHNPHDLSVPPPPAQPISADQIQNLDQVKTAIKAYYGDTLSGRLNPDGTPEHTFAPDGAYAREVQSIETYVAHKLFDRRTGRPVRHAPGQKAIVLDVDDTSLNTYNYEIDSNFVYNPTQNALFVNGAAFPAVPGMPQLAGQAVAHHYTLFFLTGRPEAQRAGTVTNLVQAGFPAVPSSQLYLKDQTASWLASCAPACTTIQYKSLTRAHIESLGYDIVADLGDQYSDLKGGYADATYKIPNPMYYLP
jgi:HAD superfamily, subfamily IIIB (Acid phosphatase)